MLRPIALPLAALIAASASAQIDFVLRPERGQFLPRHPVTGSAPAAVAGLVTHPDVKALRLVVRRTGFPLPFSVEELELGPTDEQEGGAPPSFAFAPLLEGGLWDYSLELELLGHEGVFLDTCEVATDVLVGDAYIFTGQSNARADTNVPSGLPISPWIRSYGSAHPSAVALRVPGWYPAQALAPEARGQVGALAFQFAERVVEIAEVPIALINGAVNGTRIHHHLPNPIADDPYSIYGRTLQRVRAAGLQDSIRGIVWFQGETEFEGTSEAQYRDWFHALHAAWLTDFPTIERTFVCQIRSGCTLYDLPDVFEAQREFARTVGSLTVVGTNGITRTTDTCHYRYDEYREVALAIADAVLPELYGIGAPPAPLDALDATWDPLYGTVAIRFRNPEVGLEFEPELHRRFSIETDPPAFVQASSGWVAGDALVLQLPRDVRPTKLAYLGNVLNGPWLRSSDGTPALGFSLEIESSVRWRYTRSHRR